MRSLDCDICGMSCLDQKDLHLHKKIHTHAANYKMFEDVKLEFSQDAINYLTGAAPSKTLTMEDIIKTLQELNRRESKELNFKELSQSELDEVFKKCIE